MGRRNRQRDEQTMFEIDWRAVYESAGVAYEPIRPQRPTVNVVPNPRYL